MEYTYRNSLSPYYAEAELSFSPAQDWTAGDVVALSLRFRGSAGNPNEQMYVTLEDGSGSGMVQYDGDIDDLKAESWQSWDIDLQDFGINLTNVTKLIIGFGDGISGSPLDGIVYFDDIRLYPTRVLCVDGPSMADGDLDGDCDIDFDDLAIIAGNWLKTGVATVP